MAYYTNIFSPETYQAFTNSDKTIAGFRIRKVNKLKHLDRMTDAVLDDYAELLQSSIL